MDEKQIKPNGTEQGAVQKEIEQEKWQRNYGDKLPYLIQKMDALLEDGGKAAVIELKSMFLTQDIVENYKQTNKFASMYIVMCIYELEEAAGIQQTILKQGQTTTELIDYLFQLRTILYRLDFEISTGVKDEFVSFLKQHGTSAVTLEVMLTKSVMRPLSLALKLEKIFEEFHMAEYEFYMLYFIENHWKGNLRIQQKLVQYGKAQPVSENMQDKDFVQELQELVWKFFYEADNSEEEIAVYLKNHKIENEIWSSLLEKHKLRKVEHYFLLANALLEEGICDQAETVLECAVSSNPESRAAAELLEQLQRVNRKMEK